jgi:YaaC-like Protein
LVARERIPTDDPIRLLWTRFGTLESLSGAERHVRRRAASADVEIPPDLLARKAQGLAFAVRSAREYFRIPVEGNLTVTSLAYYYGTMSLLQALLVADPHNDLALAEMEQFTRLGHGIGMLSDDAEGFPDGEYVFLLTNGFLPRFLRVQEYAVRIGDVAMARNYRTYDEVPEVERSRLINLKALFARMPELLSTYIELFDQQPEFLGIETVGSDPQARVHFPALGNSPHLTPELIRQRLDWPEEIELEWSAPDNSFRTAPAQAVTPLLEGKKPYNSVLAYGSYVTPLHGVEDVLVMQFLLLYALSILVRYRPALWREISEGDLNEYRALITHFLIVVERVVPNEVLNRIYEREFLFAPFSYVA